MKPVYAYLIALAIFLAADFLWLGVIARSFYAERIGSLLLDQPRWGVAVLFYVIYVVGLTYFAVMPGIAAQSWVTGARDGALFGFFAYLTYNATNLSVMKGYDALVAVVDTGWGTLVGAGVAGATVAVMLALGRG